MKNLTDKNHTDLNVSIIPRFATKNQDKLLFLLRKKRGGSFGWDFILKNCLHYRIIFLTFLAIMDNIVNELSLCTAIHARHVKNKGRKVC